MKNNKGFVVSAILYPLLVLFLALIMGLLAMSDTRKRILDKMKLEISDSIFDDAECSCDTILNKLNYLIKNGVGGGGGGSYSHNVLGLNVKGYETEEDMPNIGNSIGDIAVITDVEVTSYYVSLTPPSDPKEGDVWIVQDKTSIYHIKSDYSNIGISYIMQFFEGKWILKKSYVFDEARWNLLYYVSLKDGLVDMSATDVNAEIVHTYGYKGQYQTFTAIFSGYYQIELWGAQGGSYSQYGGSGAYTKGEIYLNPGDTLYIYVGGTGEATVEGWNGGGKGLTSSGYGMGGGGATDVRVEKTSKKEIWNEFESLKTRIMVAAGGGGAMYYNGSYYGGGGAGGGLTGYSGGSATHYVGIGAAQSLPGSRSDGRNIDVGGFGYGGIGGDHGYGDGAGGGGWYGGGGGYIGGGGGGSSYISGHEGCSAISEDSTASSIVHTGTSLYFDKHYYFINTKMVDGNGYSWGSVRENAVSKQPTTSGTGTQNGQSGNGYAKITLRTVEYMSDKANEEIRLNKSNVYSYSFSGTDGMSGKYQTFTAEKAGKYKVELWGAAGGSYSQSGGRGSYTSGEIYLSKGTNLYVYVGATTWSSNGGWNGGGNGLTSSGTGMGGGGATDIRLVKTASVGIWNDYESLKSRIMVAAGGGGAMYYNGSYYGAGGAGGGLTGYSGTSATHYVGVGAYQSLPGHRNDTRNANVGSFGYGSIGGDHGYGDGGGGGGYYGGGGGYIGGGGSGSSYISGHDGCNSITEDSTPSNIIHNGSPYHYSDYYFINTAMIDGNGYSWGAYRSNASTGMPSPTSSSTITGNTGDGYAKISLISEEIKSTTTLLQEKEENEKVWRYTYSGTDGYAGRYQTFTAKKTGTYQIELWGAQGGQNGRYGGKGSYTSGKIFLRGGQILYVYVGGYSNTSSPGWNGGGAGYAGYGLGGGGGTDIRLIATTSLSAWDNFESLKSRIMVAAGGGGADNYSGSYFGDGAAGGGLTGYSGTSAAHYVGIGATQTLPGNRSDGRDYNVGAFGKGGNGDAHAYGSGGGGGGYYGGGGAFIGGGGSGSSYISGHEGCSSIEGDSITTNIIHNGNAYHYSGYYFTETEMIDGNGYKWGNVRETSAGTMPSPSSPSPMVGNTGDGFAKITLLTEEEKSTSSLENYRKENQNYWVYTFSGTTGKNGRYQVFNVEKGGTYKVELWGAQGGNYSQSGGLGGYSHGKISLSPGDKLYIYVGSTTWGSYGGWNGGGNGITSSGYGMGGGGATDIRTVSTSAASLWNEADSLKTRIMVAGGGGGAMYYNGSYYGAGGAGGGLNGRNGTSAAHYVGTGGLQAEGGHRHDSGTIAVGQFGYGSTGHDHPYGDGAGGGGWYGGGGGYIGGGGGGSGYISGHAGCIAVNSQGKPVVSTYSKIDDSISYTEYRFYDTQMIDGQGYPWTTTSSASASGMPSPTSSSTMTGNSGDGYAKIAYLGA